MKKLIISVISVAILVLGCATHNHTQSMRNLTGATAVTVYARDTGTSQWGNPINVRARRDAQGQVVRNAAGSIVWDRVNVANGTEIVLFRDTSNTETPRGMRNQDIRIVDNNGMIYTRLNIPITFTTTRQNFFQSAYGLQGEALSSSEPIVFTAQDRHPILTIRNGTGIPIDISTPSGTRQSGSDVIWVSPELNLNENITVTYMSGRMQFQEQVSIANDDVTIILTRRPPTLTVINQTGARIDDAYVRNSGQHFWGENLLHIQFDPNDGSIIRGNVSSVPNTQPFHVWTGNLELTSGDIDIRFDDVNGNVFIINEVSLGNEDLRLTVTQAHNTTH